MTTTSSRGLLRLRLVSGQCSQEHRVDGKQSAPISFPDIPCLRPIKAIHASQRNPLCSNSTPICCGKFSFKVTPPTPAGPVTRPGLKFPVPPRVNSNPTLGRTKMCIAAPPINGNRREPTSGRPCLRRFVHAVRRGG